MRRLKTVLAAATVGVLASVGFVTPAEAGLCCLAADMECVRSGYKFYGYGLYEHVPDGPMRRWAEFGGRVSSVGGSLGNSSNLNFRLTQDDFTDVWTHSSPDNIRPNVDYIVREEAYTAVESEEVLRIHAIWDRPTWPDPDCIRYSETL